MPQGHRQLPPVHDSWRTSLSRHHGRLAASGTMDDLRRETASEGMTLERLFLKLTGGEVPSSLSGMFDD